MMERYMSLQSVEIIKIDYQNSESVGSTLRALRPIYVTSLWRILQNDLGLHPYTIKLRQELKPLDHQQRRMFVNWAEQQLENASDFYRKIIFSDEALFWLNGFVNI